MKLLFQVIPHITNLKIKQIKDVRSDLNRYIINLEKAPTGVYVLNVIAGDKLYYSQKLIVE